MRVRVVYILFLLFAAVSNYVLGQNDKVAYQLNLDNVYVEGKRPLKMTGLQLAPLDSFVLRDNIAQSLADILTQKATVFVKSYGRATQSTAEFRGTSPSHTQVTWNGMRINSPMMGTVDFSLIPSYFMDDATLYYGASSVILSGGGLGGAVELNTKNDNVKGFGAQYVAGFGSFSTYDQFLRLNYGDERWKSSTRIVFGKSKNNYKYTNYDKKVDVYEDGKIVDSYHPEERNKSGYFTDVHLLQDVSYKADGGNEFNLAVWYMSSLRGLPFLSVDYKDDTDFTNEQDIKTTRAVLSWKQTHDRYKLSADAGYTYSDAAYDYYTTRQDEVFSDITHSRSYTNSFFGRFDAEYSPNDKWFFTADVTAYDNGVKSRDKSPFHIGDNYDKSRFETSTSLTARWRALNRLSLATTVRQESYGNDIVSPIAAFFADYELYKPWNLVLKTSVARNYRYPSMDDCYFQPGGNPDLKPERGFTYDGGIEWKVARKRYSIAGNVAAFDSRINDWILWTPTVKGFWSPSNVKKVHNYGIEASANSTVDISSDWILKIDGSFAWTPSKNVGEKVNSNDTSYGKQLCYIPKLSSSLAARLEWKGFALSYKFCHYSERFTTTSNDVTQITGRLKPYFMSNLSLEKHFSSKWADWSVKGVVNNLLDTEYVTVLSRPMPRRNYEFFIDIRPNFGKKK